MAGILNDNVRRLIDSYIETLTPTQRLAMLLEDSSDDDDETTAALQRARALLIDEAGEHEQSRVRPANIETPENAQVFSNLIHALQPQNPLVSAASAGDYGKVSELLQNGQGANYRDRSGETALYAAAARGHTQVVSRLLVAGADPNLAENLKAWTPLHVVCQAGNESMTTLLLKGNANPNKRDNKHWTPLHVACLYGNLGCVKALIENSGDINNKDNEGRVPIHIAVDFGQEAVIALLAENEAVFDIQDSEGTTPLHIATMDRPFPPPVQLLLRLGAAVDPRDAHGVTPLCIAVANKTSDPELMIPPLIRYGADVDLQNESGFSPVFLAISEYKTQERMRYCRLVLERTQELNAITTIQGKEYTPLLYAIERRNPLAISLLLELGADVGLGVDRMNFQYLPVIAAAVARDPEQPEILATLLRAKMDPNTSINSISTLLHLCAEVGHHKCAQVLLDAKADPNALDANGSTPLHLAISKGNAELSNILIAAGADVNTGTNLVSGSPLHLAIRKYNEDILLSLIRAGGDPTAKDNQMDTPLDMIRELLRKVLYNQHEGLGAPLSNDVEHNSPLREDDNNEVGNNNARRTADSANLLSYNRVLTLMLEKMADRDAKNFGWPLMGEEGWYEAQLLSSVQASFSNQARAGPKIRDVKDRYTTRSLTSVTTQTP